MTRPPNFQATNLPGYQASNPYVGPRTFSEAQGRLFFGREREARDLTARIVSERLLLFYAQSGAGKSSLLNARVIPRLRDEEDFQVLPVGRVVGELPAGVDAVANIFVFNLMVSLDQSTENPARLAQVTLNEFLAQLVRETVAGVDGQRMQRWIYRSDAAAASRPADVEQTPTKTGPRFVLIIDQFEEIITSHPARWHEREEFFCQLDQAMHDDPNLWVVLTLREDYVAALDPYAHLMADRLRARFYMERMGVAAALDAICEPAALGGRPFASGVAERLVEDLCQVRVPGQEAAVAGQYVEPVQLQVVCYQLWGNLGKETQGSGGTQITFDDLAEAGDVNRALTQFYEETLAAALADPAAAGVSERQLRAWFDEELITEIGTRGLVRQGRQMTGDVPNAIVAKLQGRFLVRGDTRSGDTWIELVHDRFIEPIHQSNQIWFARNLNPLTLAAQAWQDAGRPQLKLYADSQLEAASRQLDAHPDEFGDLEREFVKIGKEIEQQAAIRRQRVFAALAALLFLVLTGLAAWALTNAARAGQSEQQARAAEADAILRQAEAEAASTRAVASAGTASADRAIALTANAVTSGTLATQEANLVAALTAQALVPPTVTPSPYPSKTPAVGELSWWLRWSQAWYGLPTARPTVNLTVAAQRTQLAQVRATQTEIAKSPVLIGPPGSYPLRTPSATPAAPPTRRVAWPPAGRIIFASNRDNPIADLYVMRADGAELRRLTFNTAFEPSYTPADGGRIAFTARRDQRAAIYTIAANGSQERRITGPDSDNWEPAYSPDGRYIAFVSSRNNFDWEIYVMNADGARVMQLTNDDPARNTAPAWSPDSQRIAFASYEGQSRSEIHVMDRDGGNRRRLTANNILSEYPAWSPNGRLIAFASNRDGNKDIFVMDADGRNQRNLTHSSFDENFPAWSPDGLWIAFSRFSTINPIFVMTADGEQVTKLTQGDASDWAPIWLP